MEQKKNGGQDRGVVVMCLLPRIDRYLRHTSTPPTTFGRRAVNDPRLVGDLRNGRELGPRVAARVARFLEADGW